jgi:hypothetical protein
MVLLHLVLDIVDTVSIVCRMCVTPEAVKQRDMLVWETFRTAGVPICMLLSGGYSRQSAAVVSSSLEAILKWEAALK